MLLSFIKEPALAQEKTLTMRSSFQLAAQEIYPNQTPDDAFDSMWAIPFNVKTGRPQITGLLKKLSGVPTLLRDPLATRFMAQAKKRDKGTPAHKHRNAARSFWLYVFLLLSGRCVYSRVYRGTCEGKNFKAMTVEQLDKVGSGEHGAGRKTGKGSDMRRRVGVWRSAVAAELGGMYPCCKRCNEMANALGVSSVLIARFMKYHRACEAVRKAKAAQAKAAKAARR